jgi:hypothetical protein
MSIASGRAVRHHAFFPLLFILAVLGPAPAVADRAANDVAFHIDDPLTREPETQDASRVQPWDIDLFIDLAINLFGQPGDNQTGVHAANVNTIDEVPDSSWFTNRILAREVSVDEAVRGAHTGGSVAGGTWTITAAKEAGFAPGFTIQDSAGETWFVSLDAKGHPEAATGAILVANKIFWTLGYWQTDAVLTSVRPDQLVIGDTATVQPMSRKRRRMRRDDLEAVWQRAHRSPDGSFRAVAARRLPGRALGGFRYYGTRPDDPNDITPHEHRRELRALQVFGAWTNLVDMKAGNTLDMLIAENGRNLVRHYLQDVGSTFGTGANGPREYFEGWEHVYDGDLVWKRLVSLGFFIRPWQTVPYHETVAIGRFEGAAFDPVEWKPRVPVAAIRHAQPDDLFWAARRVMAFSDEMIRALVKAARYSNPRDEQQLADTLIQRRDKIGAAYLTAVTPLVNFTLSADGALRFENAAVKARVGSAPAGGYRLAWSYFDNRTRALDPIGDTAATDGEPTGAPRALRDAPDTFVRVRVTEDAAPAARAPVDAYFRRAASGWTLVGLTRSSFSHDARAPQSSPDKSPR